jgi:cytidyltransferase-like protein
LKTDSPISLAGAFDDLHSRDVRLLHEASKLGPLVVRLLDDAAIERTTGKPPKFPLPERRYTLEAIRYVSRVEVIDKAEPANPVTQSIDASLLTSYPAPQPCPMNPESDRKKVLVTGTFDWLHSGHIRFFEEVSELGDLYAVVGHDANIRLLKGPGKPMFPEAQRCYTVGAIKFVKQAMISSGSGWLDAEPEIVKLKPDIYAVNEDGDVPEKRAYCEKVGIEYVVLKRVPKEGLPRRSSTDLRGY